MTTSPPPVYNGRYELRRQIARGGTAQVYLAHDLLLDRPVALKVLFPELSSDHSFVERFRREAQAAANLSHPNIVPIFDWGESERTYFIVMEYVDGEPLSSIIRTQAPIAPDQAAAVAADIAKALSFAHRHGVVHRDVKPGNVLITQEGQVKVTDFGIARAIGSDEQATQTGVVMGTASYFSPEQAQGLEVDGRSDVYSLGVVLFEMVTGRPPFSGDTPVSIAYQHVREHPPTPRSLNPSVPPALEAIILQAMAKLPAERYASAEAMRADLDRFVRGQTVLARPPAATFTGPTTEAVNATGVYARINEATGTTIQPSDDATVADRPSTHTLRWVVAGLLLIAAIVAIAVLGGRQLGYFGGAHYVAIPDVRGMNRAQALSTLAADHLKASTSNVSGTLTDQNQVVSETPAPTLSVKDGSTVVLTIAGPVPKTRVPRVTGLDRQHAEAALSAAGLKWHLLPISSPTAAPQYQVIKESPAPGKMVVRGTYVTLSYVENKTSSIPQTIGENEAQAAISLSKAGYTLGTVTTTFSPTVASGDVISSSPAAGTQELAGTAVNLVVSQGAGVAIPFLLGDSESQAESALTAIGLVPKKGAPIATTVAGYVGNVAAQRVVGSSAQVGDQVPPGSVVIYRIGVAANSGTVGTTTTTSTTTTTTLAFPPNA